MPKIVKINLLNLSFFVGFFILTNSICYDSSAQENDADFEKEFSKFESEINKGSIHDPFENFNTIQGMFPEEEEDKKKDDDKIEPPSRFFRLGLEDDEEDENYDYKSKSGSDILGEFTKNFK